MSRYGHEFTPATQAILARGAQRNRPFFTNRPTNEQQEQRREKMKANRVIVNPRVLPDGRQVFDVVKLCGNVPVGLYAAGLASHAEAVEVASHCLRGRLFVSLGTARALMKMGPGGLIIPDRDLTPHSDVRTRALGAERTIQIASR